MPWTTDSPPDVAKNWTDAEKARCVSAANRHLDENEGDDQGAIFACLAAAGRSKGGRFGDWFWERLADAVYALLGGDEAFGGAGSGHWGHKGVTGQKGGSAGGGGLVAIGATAEHSPFERKAMSQKTRQERELKGFDGQVGFRQSSGGPAGRAHHSGDITIDRDTYKQLPDEGRRHLIAHEITHQTVEPYVLKNMAEWDKAEQVLFVSEGRGGTKLFVGGNTRIGEAVADAVAVTVTRDTFGRTSPEKMSSIYKWAESTTKNAGYSVTKIRQDTDRIKAQLDMELG